MIYRKYNTPHIHSEKNQHPQEKWEYNSPPLLLWEMSLQQILGNQEVQRMFQTNEIMAKLYLNQPGDVYEQEADRIARHILTMRDNEVQLKSEETKILKKGTSIGDGTVSSQTEVNINLLKGKGTPLEPKIRDYFQPRFGVDLKDVRIHKESNADRCARAIRARAFTLGNDIVFARGEYKPETHEGKKLVAHEITHVLQQGGGSRIHRDNRTDQVNNPEDATIARIRAFKEVVNTVVNNFNSSSSYDTLNTEITDFLNFLDANNVELPAELRVHEGDTGITFPITENPKITSPFGARMFYY